MNIWRNFPPDEDDLRARAVEAFGAEAVERALEQRDFERHVMVREREARQADEAARAREMPIVDNGFDADAAPARERQSEAGLPTYWSGPDSVTPIGGFFGGALIGGGPDISDMTGGFSYTTGSVTDLLANLTKLDIKLDEHGKMLYQGRTVDDWAQEQGISKDEALSKIIGIDVVSALPPKEPRFKGTDVEITQAFLTEFQSIRGNRMQGREQRYRLIADLRNSVLKNPKADINPQHDGDPEDLGLLQDIHPDDLLKGEVAPSEIQQQFNELKGVPDEYYLGPGGVVRVRSDEQRANPNPVAGVLTSLRTGKYFGNDFFENFDSW